VTGGDRPFRLRFGQTYEHLLLVHWPVPIDRLAPLVPAPLAVATFEGQAYVGHDVYIGTNPRLGDLPPIPGVPPRPIVTLRTIVDLAGTRGIFLLSLDAPAPLMTGIEHHILHLRSYEAAVDITPDQGGITAVARRLENGAKLAVRYRPAGPPGAPVPGSRDEFLLGGDRLFTSDGAGATRAIDVRHGPWSLAPAEVTFDVDTIAGGLGLPGPEAGVVGVYQRSQDAYAAIF
jgi:uncharacterized protein YqjF (DUF2071 family)